MDKKLELFLLFITTFVTSFFASIMLNRLIIKILRAMKIGQMEREYLKTHQEKQGTPTLGGLSILIVGLLAFLISSFIYGFNLRINIVIITMLSFGMIGLVDDLFKVLKKNTLGISGKFRLLLELAICLSALYFLGFSRFTSQNYSIEIFDLSLKIGILIIPLLIFMLIGGSNATNLADGLDGLASGLMMIALLPFLLISIKFMEYHYSFILIAIIAANLGFLIFNVHPAKIFMGDVGSLSLGVLIVMSAIYLDVVYIIPLVMIMFILEALSVCIQVVYYKKTKKRIFLMTPLHHHYEKKNVPEYRIVIYFWLVGIIFSLFSAFLGGL